MTVYISDREMGFPDPAGAGPDGLVAVGGDLSPERLLLAYKMGIFPWYSEGDPVLWFSPDPRMVFLPNDFRFSKTVMKAVFSGRFSVRIDTDFPAVVENCASVPRPGQSGTWITEEMKDAYARLHRLGYAHSFETWSEDSLVGGLYGVSLGGAFFGESMFYLETSASMVALFHLSRKCRELGFDFVDSQVPTSHMKSLGGREIERSKFLLMLERSLAKNSLRGSWNAFSG